MRSSPGSICSAGVAILYRPSVSVKLVKCDDHGRFIIVRAAFVEVESSVIQLVNIYGPNECGPGEAFFQPLLPEIDPTIPTVLCGDFNTVPDAVLDRFGCNPSSPWAYSWPACLSSLTSSPDLVDIWRLRHPGEREYTWRRPNGTQGSRLDMFWLSSALFDLVRRVDILPFFRSDHAYVFLRFSLRFLNVVLGYVNLTLPCCKMSITSKWLKTFGVSGT